MCGGGTRRAPSGGSRVIAFLCPTLISLVPPDPITHDAGSRVKVPSHCLLGMALETHLGVSAKKKKTHLMLPWPRALLISMTNLLILEGWGLTEWSGFLQSKAYSFPEVTSLLGSRPRGTFEVLNNKRGRKKRKHTRASGDCEKEVSLCLSLVRTKIGLNLEDLKSTDSSLLSGDHSRHCPSITVLDPHRDLASESLVQPQASSSPTASVARGKCPWFPLRDLEKVITFRASWVRWLKGSLARRSGLIAPDWHWETLSRVYPSSCQSTEQRG